MAAEDGNRLHTCCFTGHRPEKLGEPEDRVKRWLEEHIDQAIRDGYVAFISGCARGIDIWAGQIVLQKKENNPDIRLIAATPWPEFAKSWSEDWQRQYNDLLARSDQVVDVCDHYHRGVFQQRNVWMVDRSSRVIAFYNGTAGGTRNTIHYAEKHGVEVIGYLSKPADRVFE